MNNEDSGYIAMLLNDRTDRLTDRLTDRQTDRPTDRVTDRQTDRQSVIYGYRA